MVKIKITDNKGAAFQGVVVLKEILEVFCLFVCLFCFSGSEKDGRDRRCTVCVEVWRKSAETVRMKDCGKLKAAVTERKGASESATTKAMPPPREGRGKLRVL